ncbi:hypothetical protein NF556_00270 [Ornithinimicrobium faecis]|uniref:Tyr recombinase domain-containing protein n=1 Tax=Ornithinimicrobium faecis TaxID=2934158 RepID=A0ABY4YU97_9MICO|nr:hypothetical protein [Ornithinimicrobium sp. HY1793]USQ80134.1 hypothetical protein NF556_00270 [Ornithinimicrobium sp. HY1793]
MPAKKTRGWAKRPPEERGHVPALHKVEVSDQERLDRLMAFQPSHVGRFTDEAIVVTAQRVATIPFTTVRDDRKRMQRLVKRKASWLEQKGTVDWAAAMSDPELDRYCEAQTHMTQGSRNSYRSYLRGDAEAMGLRVRSRFKGRRPSVTSAYSERERNDLWLDADYMEGEYERTYRIAHDLAFAAGVRSEEMSILTWDRITPRPEGAVVSIVNRKGVVRDVPIGPLPAARLLRCKAAAEAVDEFVFRPDKADRRAVVNRVLDTPTSKRVRKSRLKLSTARNTFIVNLLRKPVPFVTVAYLADLNPGGSVAQDLLVWAGKGATPEEHAAAVWGEL